MVMLDVSDVQVRFRAPEGSVTALDGVDLALAAGEFVTVIGANGAGKTTLVNVIAGVIAPTRGVVRLEEQDMRRVPEHRRARRIARVFHDAHRSLCGEMTIEENLMLALTRGSPRVPWRFARSRARRRTAIGALEQYAPPLTGRLKQRAETLSSGQGQMLAIVMAVIARPRLLLLDEHTSALDPRMSEQLMSATNEVISRSGLTTLMITHHMGIASRYGDRLLMMNHGRVVDSLNATDPDRQTEAALITRFRSSVADGLSDRMLA